MESGAENSHVGGYANKSRSLDLKSLYKSNVTNDTKEKSLKRKGASTEDVEIKKSRKKKSRKEVSLSSLENAVGERNAGEDSHKLKSGLSQKLNSRNVFKRASLSLEGDVHFPKRKRDFVGRKKFDACQRFRSSGESSGKAGLVDQISRLQKDDSIAATGSVEVKEKIYVDVEEERSFTQSSKEKDEFAGHSVANNDNGDVSLKKSKRNRKDRRKMRTSDDINTSKEAQPLVDNITISDGPEDDEDEQNLEENAAMMLSSRFDPSCTGFSSSGKSSTMPSGNGLSYLLPSGRNLVINHPKSYRRSASALGDDASRVLRPRKQHKHKGNTRKRRHFYEIFFRNLDAYWVLNRRIKVFWPLDQSWYYGLVIDYDKERSLHHIKYDDRDEEWINLQNERFKLLLLPNEVPGRTERKRSVKKIENMDSQKGSGSSKKEKKKKREFCTEGDNYVGSCMESEPIISWLTRSSLRVKSSPICRINKHKSSCLSQSSAPKSDDVYSTNCHVANHSLRADESKVSNDSGQGNGLADGSQGVNLSLVSAACPKDTKLPIVYFRKRFRKAFLESLHTAEGNHDSGSIPVSVSSLAPRGVHDLKVGGPHVLGADGGSFQNDSFYNISFLDMKPEIFRFLLTFPIRSVLNDALGSEDFWLYRAVVLLQYGAVVNKWSRVHLEILIVDNVVGLRFLLFEGSLKKALSFIFLILTTFHQPVEWGKCIDLQIPVTSIKFKLSHVQDLKKHLAFALYNFSTVKSSKWRCLDSKLKRYCILTKQLALEECTFDNIHAVQNGMNELPLSSIASEQSSFKVIKYRTRQGVNVMGVTRESILKDTSFSSNTEKTTVKLPSFALSFSAAPTFFLSLHLRLLMERSVAHISFHDHEFANKMDNSCYLVMDERCSVEGISNRESDVQVNNRNNAASDDSQDFDKKEVVGGPSVFRNVDFLLQDHLGVACSVTGGSLGGCGSDIVGSNQLHKCQTQMSEMGPPFLPSTLSTGDKIDNGSHTLINTITCEIPSLDQPDKHVVGQLHEAQNSPEFSWNVNGGISPSSNPTAHRSTWQRNRNSSSSIGCPSHGWTDRKANLFQSGFNYGPKKPRTQVSYSLPFGGFEFSSRHRNHQQKGHPHKRIRRANEKRSVDVLKSMPENLKSLCCDVNLLVTLADRGRRECGAQVLLELFDHNEWKLAVKISGITKYSYKAHQFLQPGSTNRYTHAMMWKGGKDWILEFPDRSQWAIFKEMHEECYNRNVRAASVKNIPIPGVRLIEESDENGLEVAYFRSPKYFRQVETDIQMALDPSHVMYDMDSEDEHWILNIQNSSKDEKNCSVEISEEMYEKTMDVLEKAAYAQQREEFTSDEIEELFANVCPLHVVRAVYGYWYKKRQKKGMALIRHFQPPLWEKYQKEVKEWERASAKHNNTIVNGCLNRAKVVERPPMFAFCLKPRGLELPNRGSKQRSHKKVTVSGHTNTLLGDQDGFHSIGRRLNGFAVADEKFVQSGHVYESLDDSPLSQTSPRVFSPKGVDNMNYFSLSNDGFDRNYIPKLHRRKSKKFTSYIPPSEMQMVVPYNQRSKKRNGFNQWSAVYHDWSNQRPYHFEAYEGHEYEQMTGPELDEFRMRDAASAAQHALNMAKHKRQKAHRLLYGADLAIHKTVVALMTAEAIKASQEPNGNG